MSPIMSAFFLGLAGGAHCLTMCGPIAGAMGCGACPKNSSKRMPAFFASLARVTTYVAMGATFGGLGHVVASILPGSSFRTAASIFAAVAMALSGLALLGFSWPTRQLERGGAWVFGFVSPTFRRALRKQNERKPLWLGLLWGLLPCGLVYSALALAVDSGSAFRGALTLLAFGLATLPAPLVLGALLDRGRQSGAHIYLRRAGGIAAVLFALLTLGRELRDFVPAGVPFPGGPCCHPTIASRG